jgi:hypothetical protein
MAQQDNSLFIPMHKRIAMGEKLDGTSLQPKGQPTKAPASKPQGGALAQAKKK